MCGCSVKAGEVVDARRVEAPDCSSAGVVCGGSTGSVVSDGAPGPCVVRGRCSSSVVSIAGSSSEVVDVAGAAVEASACPTERERIGLQRLGLTVSVPAFKN